MTEYQKQNEPHSDKYRIAFIVEQALGHKTHSQNLRGVIEKNPQIDAQWILPDWQRSGIASKIPYYRNNWTTQAGFQARQGLRRLHRDFSFEALFFHTQVPAVLAQDWLKRYPSIVSLDSTPLQYDALGEAYDHHPSAAWLEKIKYELNYNCFHAAKHLITWSQWAKDSLIHDYGVEAEKVTVIPPGINPQQWRKCRPPSPENVIKILFVGGNFERKGGKELIQAFSALREGRKPGTPELQLHLVTQDPVPEQAGVFIYHGLKPNSEDLRQLYTDADIFCLPTHGDCLPMVLAEAGASGLPIVSTNLAGIPELVMDGENGFLIPPKDIQALTAALSRLVEDFDLRKSMGRQSEEIIQRDHDVEKNASRLVNIILSVIDNSSRK
jgi:glycosyltransferase involved in cell wall biosynthesis